MDPRFYFYRDTSGFEVDLLVQQGSQLIPIEIKSGKTFSPSYLNGIRNFHQRAPKKASGGAVIYGGERAQKMEEFYLYNPESCVDITFTNSE